MESETFLLCIKKAIRRRIEQPKPIQKITALGKYEEIHEDFYVQKIVNELTPRRLESPRKKNDEKEMKNNEVVENKDNEKNEKKNEDDKDEIKKEKNKKKEKVSKKNEKKEKKEKKHKQKERKEKKKFHSILKSIFCSLKIKK